MSIPEIETEGSKVLVTFFWTLLPKSWRSQTLATERYLKRCVRFFIGLPIYVLGAFLQEDDTVVRVACCASQTPHIATSIYFYSPPIQNVFHLWFIILAIPVWPICKSVNSELVGWRDFVLWHADIPLFKCTLLWTIITVEMQHYTTKSLNKSTSGLNLSYAGVNDLVLQPHMCRCMSSSGRFKICDKRHEN